MLEHSGIDQAAFTWFYSSDFRADPDKCIARVEKDLGAYPLFVKPANAGSSVGITKAHSREELVPAIEKALKEDSRILIEENIIGKEVECAVLGNENPFVSTPGQIVPAAEFYDYDAKYNGHVQEITPARLSEDITRRVREITSHIYDILHCNGIIRIDYIISKEGKISMLEVNTTPGMTPTSFIPQQVRAAGLSMTDVLTDIVENQF